MNMGQSLLGANASEEKGEHARLSAMVGAIAVADLVKTTLGPKGMDKILQSMGDSKKILVTNDGATILKSIPVDNAAAKIIIDTSKTQDKEVGDGTTSVAVLAGELLREAEKLINKKIHPQTIINGWRKAVKVAMTTLTESAIDNSHDEKAFREDLINIAKTTISSKILAVDKNYFSELAVSAILRLKDDCDLENIQIIKKVGGNLRDSYLEEGFILDKEIGIGQPKKILNPKILVANTHMDHDKIKILPAVINVTSTKQLAEIERAEREKMKKKVQKILGYNIDCFINRQLIYNYPEQLFTENDVVTIEHADFEGVERLSLVLGADIASTFDGDIKLGECKCIEEVVIGESKVIRFSGVSKGEACTVVLRGASKHILDEAERSLHDALCVLQQTVKNPKTVLGGGCSEVLMATAVDKLAKTVAGKESMAIKAFAQALRQIPCIIAENAGYDPSELISQLDAEHFKGNKTAGLDMDKGKIGDVGKLKITESFKCKSQVLVSAHGAAEMIVRIDTIVTAMPRQRQQGH